YLASNSNGGIRYNSTSFATVWWECMNDFNSFGEGSLFLDSGTFPANFTSESSTAILPVTNNVFIKGTGTGSVISIVPNMPDMGHDIEVFGDWPTSSLPPVNVTIE